jgi:hypothetical protein
VVIGVDPHKGVHLMPGPTVIRIIRVMAGLGQLFAELADSDPPLHSALAVTSAVANRRTRRGSAVSTVT